MRRKRTTIVVNGAARRVSKWMVTAFILSGVASVFGLASIVYTAIQMGRAGRGLETYRTFWLVEFNWIGVLILLALIPLALLVGLFFRLREQREWRSLARKYGVRDRNV
jgi:hypothetical protein